MEDHNTMNTSHPTQDGASSSELGKGQEEETRYAENTHRTPPQAPSPLTTSVPLVY